MINRARTMLILGASAVLGMAGLLTPFGCGSSDASLDDVDSGSDVGTDSPIVDPVDSGGGQENDASNADASDGSLGLADGDVLDGGTTTEAGPGGDTTTLPCGAINCPVTGATCCTYPGGDAGTFSYLCIGGSVCPDGKDGGQTATTLRCTSTANCAPGMICCVEPIDDNQGLQAVKSSCKASCTGDSAQLCDRTAANPGCAADAGACSSTNITTWNLPPSFATCGGVHAP